MLIPIRTDYRLSHRPWMNYLLLAANVAVFLAGYNGNTAAGMRRVDPWLLHPESPELYQFFSCVFLHGSWIHLAGNMLFLWVFGNAINDRLGAVGYLAFYLAGGVAAGVGYTLFSGDAPVLGASGAISAVTGAYLVLLPRARVTVLAWLLYVLVPIELSSLFFLGFQLLFNVVMIHLNLEGRAGGVAWGAHVTGYAFGIAVSAVLLATRILPRDALDLLNLLRAGRRRRQYRRMVVGGFDPFGFGRPAGGESSKRIAVRRLHTATPDNAMSRELNTRREIGEALARQDLATAAGKYEDLLQAAPEAVLPRQQQLDLANYLMSSDQYPRAADAYERFLKHYGGYEQLADIYLMLGLVYGRYLHQRDRAEQCLQKAIGQLSDPHKLELARADLEALRRGPD